MSAVESFERKALFNITRVVALIIVSVFLIGVIGTAVFGYMTWAEKSPTTVTPEEIIEQLKPPPAPANDATPSAPAAQSSRQTPDQSAAFSPLAGYKIPFALQKYVSGDNAQVLKDGLDRVPEADRQTYLDELAAVVAAADANHVDAIQAINTYMKTKADKYTAAAAKTAGKFETLKMVAAVIGSGLLAIALFSLVLVLLAIERNTRPTNKAAVPANMASTERA